MLNKDELLKLPIIITTMSRWDNSLSSASLALAKVFSKTNKVYYIDYPVTCTAALRHINTPMIQNRLPAMLFGKKYLNPIPGQTKNLMSATPRLALPIYSLRQGKILKAFTHINNIIVASLIERILKKEGINNYIFINSFNPAYLSDVQRYLKPTVSVYQSRDMVDECLIDGITKEDECVRNYDLSIATSMQLCKTIAQRNRRPVLHLPNGGDVALFKSALQQSIDKPNELKKINTPIIGYTGALTKRIDYELIKKLAHYNRDKTIVFIGPIHDKDFQTTFSEYKNIALIEPKKIEELPAYLRWFDCAIIPFVCSHLTSGIYPLKINEYLAAGRPVVSTNFSEDVNQFSKHINVANSHDDFLEMIGMALKDNTPERQKTRLEAASLNSWEHRVSTLKEMIWMAYLGKQ